MLFSTTKDVYLHLHFACDPSDEHFNYQETLRLRLQYECVRYAITLTRAPHTPSEKKKVRAGEV